MNILLVYPKYPDTFWSFSHIMKFIAKKAAFPPLGLLTIAPMLPGNKKLIDLNVHPLTDEHIAWADMILISAMVVQKESVREIVERAKHKKIVAGGPLFTTGHENFKDIDHFVLNEAEVTLPMFLKDLRDSKLKHIYTSELKPDITKTPKPDWSLIDFRDYATMCVQYSRGCPFNCEFCDIIIMNGRIPRTKKDEQLLAELDSLRERGWRGSVFIVDDNFIGNNKVKKMLPKLIQWQKKHRYPFALLTEASINLADDEELMQLMKAANFYKVFIGIETPEMDSLKECSKLQNTKSSMSDAVKKIQQHGLQVLAGFIVGFDNDKENIFKRQIRFIQKTGIVTAMVGLLNALPQTRLWKRLKSEKRLTKEITGENTDGSLNFIPKMGSKKLLEGYKHIISSIYSPKLYYKRIDTMVRNYRPSVRGKLSMAMLRAFFRSMWVIGIRSSSRFYYWKLLIKTLIRKKQCFSVAVEAAIHGHHFQKVAKKMLAN